MSKSTSLSLTVLFACLLQACGGGSGDAGGAGFAASASTADTGKVTARFVANENTRRMLLSTNVQSFGSGVPAEQTDSGALVSLGTTVLSGTRQTVDIAGDASFALGRWVRGTLITSSASYTLDGKDHESFHYAAYHRLAELPAKGQFQCKLTAATAATATAQTREKVGSASGAASVAFDAGGASTQGAIRVQVGAKSSSVELATTLKEPSAVGITGRMFANGAGAAVVLADQGGAVPGLIVGYKAQLPGGDFYLGIARFACSPT